MANHHRINILLLLASRNGDTVENLARELQANFKTISQHTRYLAQAGLLRKRYRGRSVLNTLSPYGNAVARFIRDFQRIGDL
ncbi:MAG: helix-turn-helix domain-containing protein [bacterium]|nr:helix-turn-helix domain-containing protein [bacterium]